MDKLQRDRLIRTDEKITIQRAVVRTPMLSHAHDFVEMAYLLSGTGSQTVNGRELPVGRGALLFLNFQDWHAITPDPDHPDHTMEYINILVAPSFFSDEPPGGDHAFDMLALAAFADFRAGDAGQACPVVCFRGREMLEVESLVKGMLAEFTGEKPGYLTMLKSSLHILLILYLRKTPGARDHAAGTDNPVFREAVAQVLEYIEKNHHTRLTLPELARMGFYNPSYFSRMFSGQFGMTLREYMASRRLDTLRILLETTELPVREAARQAGFGNMRSLYRIFRERTGMSPDAYRKAIRAGNEPSK
jgi:AraC-like DNA-binding protein